MIRDALSQFPLTDLTSVGMMIFIGIFLVAIVRTYHPRNKQLFQDIETLPLKEDHHG